MVRSSKEVKVSMTHMADPRYGCDWRRVSILGFWGLRTGRERGIFIFKLSTESITLLLCFRCVLLGSDGVVRLRRLSW